MLAFEYVFAFSMIYLIIFGILNYKQKKHVKWINLAIFILLAILGVIRQVRYGYQPVGSFEYFVGVGLVLFMVLYALDGFKSWRAWLSIVIAVYISTLITSPAQGFIYSLSEYLSGYQLNLLNDILAQDAISNSIGTSFGAALLFIFHQLAKKFGLKINVNALSGVEIVFLLLFLTIFGFFVMITFNISELAILTLILINLATVVSVIVGVYFVMYFATQRSTIFEIQSREKQQELIFDEQKQNYERMEKRNEEIKIFKHSIRDELLYLHGLLHNYDLRKANSYLNQMRGKLAVIEQNIGHNTGSKAVNASWYSVTSSKRYKEVEATWLGRLQINPLIDDRDLVLLFSNLLNNAFEAACKAIDDKYVVVKVEEKENGLLVLVRNSYYGEIVEKLDGDFVTTKDDKKNHGMGVRIIKNVVEKYGGKVKFSYSSGEFVVAIAFNGALAFAGWEMAQKH